MQTPQNEQPLTREDVKAIIRIHSETFVDFSGKLFESGIDLSGINLQGAKFRNSRFRSDISLAYPNFTNTELSATDFSHADLAGADFSSANLVGAKFYGCYFARVKMTRAFLSGVDWSGAEDLNHIHWGTGFLVGEETEGDLAPWGFDRAREVYRGLRNVYLQSGYPEIAAEFFYREMECRKKQAPRDHKWRDALKLAFFHTFVGYGEKPERTFLWAAWVIVVFAAFLFTFGGLTCGTEVFSRVCSGFDALYLSSVSFTALGYGGWAATPNEIGRFIGVLESFIGVFTMALFVTLFVRKMAR